MGIKRGARDLLPKSQETKTERKKRKRSGVRALDIILC